MHIFSNSIPSWAIILILVAGFGLIVLAVILVKRHVSSLQIKKDDIDEKEMIQQELDRVLVPIEDEEVKKEMQEEKEKEEHKDGK